MKNHEINQTFKLPVRVYIEDTDVGGIVFYANYLKYFERARTEYVRHLGFELRGDFAAGVGYVVHSLDIRYLAPAKLDEMLLVSASVVKLGKTYIDFSQNVVNESGVVLVQGKVKVACVNLESNKPRALPSWLYDLLQKNEVKNI